MLGDARSFSALTCSLVLHALLLVAVLPGLSRAAHEPERPAPIDVWAGDTVDVEAPGSGQAAPAAPAQPSEPPPSAAPVLPAPAPEPSAPAPPSAPSATEPSARAPRDPAAEQRAVDRRPASDAPASRSESAPGKPETEPARTPEWERLFAAQAARAGSSASGSFGAPAGAAPVRNLAYAFTRAIPNATSADRTWARLPLGSAGSVRVEIVVAEAQHIDSVEPLDTVVPPHLRRLIESTLRFLKTGRFSLSAAGVSAGRETLELEVTILEDTAGADFELGFDAPRVGRPGKAYFRNWGRRFEAKVTIVSSRAAR